MATTAELLASIASRASATAALNADELGRAIREFADHGALPSAALLNATLDAELAAYLATGGSSTGPWAVLLEAARSNPAANTNAIKRAVDFGEIVSGGSLRSIRHGVGGKCAVAR